MGKVIKEMISSVVRDTKDVLKTWKHPTSSYSNEKNNLSMKNMNRNILHRQTMLFQEDINSQMKPQFQGPVTFQRLLWRPSDLSTTQVLAIDHGCYSQLVRTY